MLRNLLAVLFSAIVLGACAFTPHDVAISATAPDEPSTIGQGIEIALNVYDDREDLVVGQRGTGMQGADITAMGVMSAITIELRRGLEAKGFTVLGANATAPVDLEVRLRAFKFFLETGFWALAINTNVAMGVEAEIGNGDFKRIYRSTDEQTAMVAPEGSVIDQKLNTALSSVLSQIMNDEELMAFLTSQSGS